VPTAEQQIKSFVDKFDPEDRTLIRAVRKTMRKRLPTAHELVYDNYNFLVFGFGSSERPSDCIMSLACGSSGVGLCFIHGKGLPDPKKLLLGSGNQTRFIRVPTVDVLNDAGVKALMKAAVARAQKPLAKTGKGTLIIRSVSAKQRPRRRTGKR
jgi:hypothetical protein